MQLKEILQKTTQFLKDKGSPSARLDTELLLAAALKWDRIKLYINYEYPMSEDELTVARDFVRRRAAGEPVAYILGTKDFYNYAFKVNNSVLIPRPETETIVETVIDLVSGESEEKFERVVDLGTGSGCIGLSILAGAPSLKLLAVDVSPAAIEIAKENAAALKIDEHTKFLVEDAGALEGDRVSSLLGGLADIVVANPPYIDSEDKQVETNVRKYEPGQALFSPDHGLSHIRAWAQTAAQIARDGAFVMFEIGAEQGAAAAKIFTDSGHFRDVERTKDLFGRERFIRARVART